MGGIYHDLGARPVINACGIYSDLGGSILSPVVWAAMTEANRTFADMVELLEGSGRVIAGLIGAEAARVTPGASAAIALGTAACLTGTDGTRMEQLPDTTGMKDEVVIQRRHRYKYDRMVRLTGARLVEAGGSDGTAPEQLMAALGTETAAVCFPAHLDGIPGTVGMRETVTIARERGVPVLVDAAYLNYPPNVMGSFSAAGADLVCFSAKYFGGPNAGGFIAGRGDLLDAVAGVDFTGFESGRWRIFGRPYKLDRQTVVAVVVALREWLAMDHAARFAGYARRVAAIRQGLAGIPGITLTPMFFTMQETYAPEPTNCLEIQLDPEAGQTPAELDAILRAGDPSVRTIVEPEAIVVVVETVTDDDVPVVVERLRAVLAGRPARSTGRG